MGLTLVAPRPEHLPHWLAWRSEPVAQSLMPLGPQTLEALERRLSTSSSDVNDLHATELRWFLERDGDPVGTLSAQELRRDAGVVKIGFMLGQRFHRQGLGTQAVRLLLDRLLVDGPFVRVWLTTSEVNLAAQRLAQKLGMTEEARLRSHLVVHGRRRDQLAFGILKDEWLRRRQTP